MQNKYNTLCMSCTRFCKQLAVVTVIECPKYDYNGSRLPKQPPAPKSDYRELTRYEKTAIAELVTSMCANYEDEYNICLLLDTACPMLTKHYHNGKLCNYFENAVLPLNTKLELCLQDKISLAKKCSTCNAPFIPCGRQLYCTEHCKVIGRRISERNKKRKQRQNKG